MHSRHDKSQHSRVSRRLRSHKCLRRDYIDGAVHDERGRRSQLLFGGAGDIAADNRHDGIIDPGAGYDDDCAKSAVLVLWLVGGHVENGDANQGNDAGGCCERLLPRPEAVGESRQGGDDQLSCTL